MNDSGCLDKRIIPAMREKVNTYWQLGRLRRGRPAQEGSPQEPMTVGTLLSQLNTLNCGVSKWAGLRSRVGAELDSVIVGKGSRKSKEDPTKVVQLFAKVGG